jgi:hypothetical protein
MVVKISAKSNSQQTQRALQKLAKNRTKKKKTLANFYGKMQGVYGDGLDYQKKVRNEWS